MPKDKKAKKLDVNFEIVEEYGYLDDEHTKIYAKIRWFDKEPKDMVSRVYHPKNDPDAVMIGKGIDLTPEEIARLNELVQNRPKPPKPVDFNQVFEQSRGIMDTRAKGHTTKDGFIVLKKRQGVQ